jgi:predicted AAA+ superfamily ATPase
MKAWTDVVRPHEDILAGDLEMAVFAADLGSVVSRDRSVREVYRDPAAFFRSTYLTTSMRSLLSDVLGALSGRSGDRVLQLRTPFGGGKTHSLLALYHVTTGRAGLGSFTELADLPDPGSTRVAVLSGVDLDPSSPRTHDGTVAKTMWGELAWQLGGADAYRLVAAQDETGQAPGKDVLAQLLPADVPTLLLLDEVLVYVEKAKALPLGDSTLGAQVLLFLQALTELVGSHPRAAMVYSLQKSVLEAAGDESLLLALDHLVTRVDAKREPVTGDEVMRVVQRRLFSDLGSEDDRRATADGYAEIFRRYRRQLAETEEERRNADAEAGRFAERISASYPFHPALLDLMHQRWTTLPSYQRTRGALQFLATVVHALWGSDWQQLPLIAPGDVRFDDERVRGAFFSQVGDREGFTGVLERDLTGANAGVKEIDRRLAADSHRLATLRVGTRVASATMLYSFGGRTDEEKGVLEGELVGALLAPDLDRNLLTTALADLRDELLFLHHTGRRYRFDKTPNLNQLLVNEADKLSAEEVTAAVRSEIERKIGASQSALLWPMEGRQIPDEEPVFRVAYLDPSWATLAPEARDARLRELYERRGHGAPRAFRNSIAFAFPNGDAIGHARQAARRQLAAQSLVKQAKSLNIAGEQLSELKERGESSARELSSTLDRAYETVLLPVARDGIEAPYGFEEIDLSARLGLGRLLHDRVAEGLSNHVFESITPQKLAGLLNLGDAEDHARFVRAQDVVNSTFSYLQFPKLWSEIPIRDAIAKGVTTGVLGYAAHAEERDGRLDVRPELVSVQRPIGPDEVDLGPGGYVLAAGFARELSATPEVTDEPEALGANGGAPSTVTGATPLPARSGKRMLVKFRAEKNDVFNALRILSAISDHSEAMDVDVTIVADAKEDFDRSWVRNAVSEPLDEVGVDSTVDIVDE